jgi:hypothetical protein
VRGFHVFFYASFHYVGTICWLMIFSITIVKQSEFLFIPRFIVYEHYCRAGQLLCGCVPLFCQKFGLRL